MRNAILIFGGLLAMVACGDKDGDTGAAVAGDGAEVYSANCAMCHGADGEGGVGTALVDSVPGSSESYLTDVVTNGVEGTSMTAYGSTLTQEEIDDVVQFMLAEWG